MYSVRWFILQTLCVMLILVSVYGMIHTMTGWPEYGPVDIIKLLVGGV